jgi:hypothetical protein
LRYLRQNQIQLPFRPVGGLQRGQLQWRRSCRETLRLVLLRPAYAGVFTWGWTMADPKRPRARVRRQPQDCPVFKPDNHDAYISWEQYENNQRRLKEEPKRGPRPGPGKTTTATLAGLIQCGHCGCRMQARYTKILRYDCQRHALDGDGPACQRLVGKPLEQLVAAQILQVVTPASLELSRRAAEQTERERNALDKNWRLCLERAHQDTDRAFRQFNAVEPENRLVARTLERRWEDALLAQRTLQEEYTRFQQTKPTKLSEAERAQIETLARDLPSLWHSPKTSVEDKRQVVRLLLQRVVVWAPSSSDQVKVQLHWAGGTMTEHHLRRPVRAWSQLADLPTILERIRQKRVAGWTSRQIAEDLNASGHCTPHGRPFTAVNVRQLLKRAPKKTATKSRRQKKRKPTSSSKSN